MATPMSSDLSLTSVAHFLGRLAERMRTRGVTDDDLACLMTENGDGLADEFADLLADKAKNRTESTFPVTVDYRFTLKAMIRAGNYDYVNSDITAKNFPVTAGPKDVVLELVHLNRPATSDEVMAEIDRRGLRPATLPELLAFGAANPEKQREFPIVALGSVWRVWDGDRRVPLLWGGGHGRGLNLNWLGVRWGAAGRFAAVRK